MKNLRSTFFPKLLTTLETYTHTQFASDVTAGIVVGIVAIPLAIAFGIASGVTPEKGLITAVVAGFIISALGGSRVQIGGPTGAFIVIVYGIVQKYGVDGLITATILAGFLLIVMGLARLGTAIKFVPHSVVIGFTSGIAVVILSSQAKDFFGLSIPVVPAEFIDKWREIFTHLGSFNIYAFIIASGTVLLVGLWPRVSRKIPGSILAIGIFAFAAHYGQWPVETIGSRFGDLPSEFPLPHWPRIDLDLIRTLIGPAFAIALLGSVESLLSAVVSDGMIGGRHRSNTELVAQGLANIASGLYGGVPATGAIARTVTNIKNGGRTPVAGMIHALTIFVVVHFFRHYVKFIPMACLAGILAVVAYHMSEWRSVRQLFKGTREGIVVFVVTFLLTVFIDLTAAIEVGMVLSLFIFMRRMAKLTSVQVVMEKEIPLDDAQVSPVEKIKVPEGVEIYEINGPFFFGVAHKFDEASRVVADKPQVRILRLRNVPLIDGTGLHALKAFYEKSRKQHIHLLITGLHVQPLNELIKANLFDLIGEENVFGNMRDTLKRAEELIRGV